MISEKDNNMIRPAERKDASRLAEILIFTKRVAYRSIFHNDIVSFNEMQVLELALSFRDNEHALNDLYVYDDGIVKGLIRWSKESKLDSDKVRVHEIYVDTFFQGQGIGSILIHDCIHRSKELGCNEIILWVLEENFDAREFYEKHGFIYGGKNKPEEGTSALLLEYALEL
jgi:Acetyltransferases